MSRRDSCVRPKRMRMGNFTPMSRGAACEGLATGREGSGETADCSSLAPAGFCVLVSWSLILTKSLGLQNSSRGRPLLDHVGPQAQHGLRFELADARGVDAQDLGNLVQVLLFLEIQRQDGSLQAWHFVHRLRQQLLQLGSLQDSRGETFFVMGDIAEQLAFGESVGD